MISKEGETFQCVHYCYDVMSGYYISPADWWKNCSNNEESTKFYMMVHFGVLSHISYGPTLKIQYSGLFHDGRHTFWNIFQYCTNHGGFDAGSTKFNIFEWFGVLSNILFWSFFEIKNDGYFQNGCLEKLQIFIIENWPQFNHFIQVYCHLVSFQVLSFLFSLACHFIYKVVP